MSARTDLHFAARRGVALLLALATMVIGAICALALWHTRAAAERTLILDAASLRATAAADSLLLSSLTLIDTGGWRNLTPPAGAHRVIDLGSGADRRRADVARIGWGTLLARGDVSLHTGVRHLPARSEHRVLIPLVAPMAMPVAALTGTRAWFVDPGAVVALAPPLPIESNCRAGRAPVAVLQDSAAGALDSTLVTPLDPDTVSAPVAGVFRLTRDRITRPMVITGMVESVTGLHVGADLLVTGVLLVRGSVIPSGGRLDVTGAVVAGDAGGTRSSLGAGDRVRYDACAIRRAVARATRPGAMRTWTTLRLF